MPPTCLSSLRHAPRLAARRYLSSDRTIKEFDVLFLRQRGRKHAKWHLTKPLKPGMTVKLAYGVSLRADDLIGRKMLEAVDDKRGGHIIPYDVSLANYIVNRDERVATPIYPADASTIVSLLDLNMSRPGEEEDENDAEPFEVFEAGTGMGSLTLHIARALHAANPPVSAELRRGLNGCSMHSPPTSTPKEDDAGANKDLMEEPSVEDAAESNAGNTEGQFSSLDDIKPTACSVHLHPDYRPAWEAYRSSRRAILHTLDNRFKHTSAALRLVRDFQRALYLPNIEFHSGRISDFIAARLSQNGGRPFLSRVVLDLAGTENYAEPVIQAMRPSALLVLFKPSISQIGDFASWAQSTGQPVLLERVIELPTSTRSEGLQDGGGNKEWDVRLSRVRADSGDAERLVQVMRPKVGDRIAGGGFVAVFRRRHADSVEAEAMETDKAEAMEDADESEHVEVGNTEKQSS